MKLNFIYFLIIGLCVFTLQQCKPDDPCDPNQIPLNETYYLTIDDKQKIPFFKAEFDSLVYVSDKGDTAVLYKQPPQNYFWKARRNANPGCPLYDFWNHETYEFEFKGKHPLLNYINFKVSTHDGFRGDGFDDTHVYFAIRTYKEFKFTTRFDRANDTIRYTDTANINNKIYTGLILFGAAPDELKFTYNYQYGILKITNSTLIWKKQ